MLSTNKITWLLNELSPEQSEKIWSLVKFTVSQEWIDGILHASTNSCKLKDSQKF